MSDYRDDTSEWATAGDAVWGGVHGRPVEEYAAIAAVLLATIGATLTDTAQAADAVIDRAVCVCHEQARITDEAFGSGGMVAQTLTETARAQDAVFGRTRATLTDTAAAHDELLAAAHDARTETARIADATSGTLHAAVLVQEQARMADGVGNHVTEHVAEAAQIEDAVSGTLHARGWLVDVAQIADEATAAHTATTDAVTETAQLADHAWDALHAGVLVDDVACIQDTLDPTQTAVHGQAWVSEAATWAMSRYAPFGFHAAANVGGTVFLAGADGLYALDGNAEDVPGTLRFGAIDLSGGTLARPVSLYLEYLLAGELHVTVGQTQMGARQQWTYQLPPERADELTNGRVLFGRGLRGRHFDFEVRMDGRAGYINDATLLVEQASRRI